MGAEEGILPARRAAEAGLRPATVAALLLDSLARRPDILRP
jgi:hypothetical protein